MQLVILYKYKILGLFLRLSKMLHVLRTKKGFKITFFVNMKGKIYTLNIVKLNFFKMINDVIRCFKLELSIFRFRIREWYDINLLFSWDDFQSNSWSYFYFLRWENVRKKRNIHLKISEVLYFHTISSHNIFVCIL